MPSRLLKFKTRLKQLQLIMEFRGWIYVATGQLDQTEVKKKKATVFTSWNKIKWQNLCCSNSYNCNTYFSSFCWSNMCEPFLEIIKCVSEWECWEGGKDSEKVLVKKKKIKSVCGMRSVRHSLAWTASFHFPVSTMLNHKMLQWKFSGSANYKGRKLVVLGSPRSEYIWLHWSEANVWCVKACMLEKIK